MDNVVLEITQKCPLKCKSCYIGQEEANLNIDGFKYLIDQLPEFEHLYISGGEPFTNVHLLDMVKYMNEKRGIKPDIFTSGFITPPNIAEFKDRVNLIRVTVKYGIENPDDEWRGIKGALSKTRKFLKTCAELGIPLACHHVLDAQNYVYIDDMIEFDKGYGAEPIFLPFIAYDQEYRSLMLPEKKFTEITTKLKEAGYIVEMTEDTCTAGFKRCAIGKHGVRGCVYFPSWASVGSLENEYWPSIERKLQDQRMTIEQTEWCKGYCPVYQDAVNGRWRREDDGHDN